MKGVLDDASVKLSSEKFCPWSEQLDTVQVEGSLTIWPTHFTAVAGTWGEAGPLEMLM